jgi:hypothetical protein
MNAAENLCGEQAIMYYNCRRERDAQLFSAIKDWEVDTYKKLQSPESREQYISQLEEKKQKLA